jgi:Ion channel
MARRPLQIIASRALALSALVSLHDRLLGGDPDAASALVSGCARRRGVPAGEAYAIYHDIYILTWIALEVLALGAGAVTGTAPAPALVICLLAAGRLLELLGGICRVMIRRRAYDDADERKLLMSLLVYLEGALLFANLHWYASRILLRYCSAAAAYATPAGIQWTSWTALYFSVGTYTTVGWGDVHACHPLAMVMSSVEAIVGVFVLAITISGFVSRAYGGLPKGTR